MFGCSAAGPFGACSFPLRGLRSVWILGGAATRPSMASREGNGAAEGTGGLRRTGPPAQPPLLPSVSLVTGAAASPEKGAEKASKSSVRI